MKKQKYIDNSAALVERPNKVLKKGNRNERGILSEEERAKINSTELKKYRNDYAKEVYRSISLKYNAQKEADIIEWLDSQPSLKGYLMALLNTEIESTHVSREFKKEAKKSAIAKENQCGKQTTIAINKYLHKKFSTKAANFTKNDLAKVIPELSASGLSCRIQKLCAIGVLEKNGAGKDTYYIIKKDPLAE